MHMVKNENILEILSEIRYFLFEQQKLDSENRH